MFTVTKRIEVSSKHWLELPYDSPCKTEHGHNWIIIVEVKARKLDEEGMVIDFAVIKKVVKRLDHTSMNEVINKDTKGEDGSYINPTAENIAAWICGMVQRELDGCRDDDSNESFVSKVTVQECEGNIAYFKPPHPPDTRTMKDFQG